MNRTESDIRDVLGTVDPDIDRRLHAFISDLAAPPTHSHSGRRPGRPWIRPVVAAALVAIAAVVSVLVTHHRPPITAAAADVPLSGSMVSFAGGSGYSAHRIRWTTDEQISTVYRGPQNADVLIAVYRVGGLRGSLGTAIDGASPAVPGAHWIRMDDRISSIGAATAEQALEITGDTFTTLVVPVHDGTAGLQEVAKVATALRVTDDPGGLVPTPTPFRANYLPKGYVLQSLSGSDAPGFGQYGNALSPARIWIQATYAVTGASLRELTISVEGPVPSDPLGKPETPTQVQTRLRKIADDGSSASINGRTWYFWRPTIGQAESYDGKTYVTLSSGIRSIAAHQSLSRGELDRVAAGLMIPADPTDVATWPTDPNLG